jgi:hypothetical protein
VKGANLARKAQAILGHPLSQELSQVVSNNFGINNGPINPIDISNADAIYGRNLGGIRGKTVRKKPEHIHGETIKIPKDFYKLHHFVTLTADIMYVNGVAFLTTLSRKISLQTVEHIQSQSAALLSRALTKVMKLNARGGFVVNLIMMDGKFATLESEFDIVEINTTAAREHVGEIERSIQTIKKQGQSFSSVLPYTTLPKQLAIHLVYYVVMFLNAMPSKTGISDTISPREIVMRCRLDWNKHCTGEFGKYVEAHSDPDVTNNNHVPSQVST